MYLLVGHNMYSCSAVLPHIKTEQDREDPSTEVLPSDGCLNVYACCHLSGNWEWWSLSVGRLLVHLFMSPLTNFLLRFCPFQAKFLDLAFGVALAAFMVLEIIRVSQSDTFWIKTFNVHSGFGMWALEHHETWCCYLMGCSTSRIGLWNLGYFSS